MAHRTGERLLTPPSIGPLRGALIDVDGTLLSGADAIPGAAETLRLLRGRGIPFLLATNTSRRPCSAIAAALARAGIEVAAGEIVVPARLARRRILDSGDARAALLVPEEAKEDFAQVVEDEEAPAWVVVGDLGRGFTFDRLNRAFRWIGTAEAGGSRLIALHMNRFWDSGADGIVLDAGPFVAALEYATGRQAEVVGKPAPAFFDLALKELGVPAADVVCVGDSLVNDCLGAKRAGCRTVLVRTGIFDAAAVARSDVGPDLVIDSIADLRPD